MAPDARMRCRRRVRPHAQAVHSAHSPARTRRSTEVRRATRPPPVPPSPRNPVLARFSRRASREPHSVVVVNRRNPHHTVTPITVTHSDAPRARAPSSPSPVPTPSFLTPPLPFPRDHSTQADRPPRIFAGVALVQRRHVRAGVHTRFAPRRAPPPRCAQIQDHRASRPSRRARAAPRRRPPDASDASDTSVDASRVGGVVVAAVAALSVVADVAIAAPAETVAPGELSAEALYGRVSADNAAKAGESVSTSAAPAARRVRRFPRSSLTPGRRSPRWRSLASSP